MHVHFGMMMTTFSRRLREQREPRFFCTGDHVLLSGDQYFSVDATNKPRLFAFLVILRPNIRVIQTWIRPQVLLNVIHLEGGNNMQPGSSRLKNQHSSRSTECIQAHSDGALDQLSASTQTQRKPASRACGVVGFEP